MMLGDDAVPVRCHNRLGLGETRFVIRKVRTAGEIISSYFPRYANGIHFYTRYLFGSNLSPFLNYASRCGTMLLRFHAALLLYTSYSSCLLSYSV